MAQSDTLRALRWSRWGLMVVAVSIATALSLSSWLGLTSAEESALSVERGQSAALFEAVVSKIGPGPHGPPSDEELQEVLESLEASGLRYIAIYRLPDELEASAGQPEGELHGFDEPILPHDMGLRPLGERMRFIMNLGPPGPRRPPGPRGEPDMRPPRPPGPPPRGRAPKAVVIEFDPGAARTLVTRARTSFYVSSSVAGALLLAALAGFFWLKREEHQVERRTREKQLASLGEMSAVLAHEIRNPLASLKGHAQLLAELPEEDERKAKKVDRIVTEATRLELLTTNLLTFVRTGEIHPEPVELSALTERLREEAGDAILDIDCEGAPKGWTLDPDRIVEALLNLVRNASEASEGQDTAVFVRFRGSKERLIIEVEDRGLGIPDEVLPYIFDPFHTNKTRGTGLGLAVTRRIVELHGGSIDACNRDEGGARFRIELPAA